MKDTLTSETEASALEGSQMLEEKDEQSPRAASNTLIGRVASPPRLESTAEQYYFWANRGRIIENNQFVRTESTIDGQAIRFYGIIDEVRRTSRKRDIQEEYDTSDGDAEYEPEFKAEGVTYASVKILRTEPDILTPPLEQSVVHLGDETDADRSYGFSEMAKPMPVGRLCNGAQGCAGLAKIDLAYLLGDNGGHLNVTGMAGAGTKTSSLLTVIKSLLHKAEQQNDLDPLYIVPIILNVKGEDLMWIDRVNRHFGANARRHDREDWAALGIEPAPFVGAQFFTPTEPNTDNAPTIDGCNATAYSWSLADILADESFPLLFAGEENPTSPMMALVYDIVATLTEPDNVTLKEGSPRTWRALLNWISAQAAEKEDHRACRNHQTGTWRAVYRRLFDILAEGESIFPMSSQSGQPLRVVRETTSPPQVIDIHGLTANLQRFVVGSILRQVVAARTGRNAIHGLRYLIMLDELNRFAPRNATDPITRLLERVATEMRSQGVILLGAQQLASQVSTKVIEMSSVRALGRTGSAELQDKVWQSWDKSARQQANILKLEEKLVVHPPLRQPMRVRLPYPAWAMRREDILAAPFDQTREV